MDEIKKDLKEVRESQIRMEADLKYHIKRTDLLEDHVDGLETKIELLSKPIPFRDILKIAGTAAAFFSSILMIINHFKK